MNFVAYFSHPNHVKIPWLFHPDETQRAGRLCQGRPLPSHSQPQVTNAHGLRGREVASRITRCRLRDGAPPAFDGQSLSGAAKASSLGAKRAPGRRKRGAGRFQGQRSCSYRAKRPDTAHRGKAN